MYYSLIIIINNYLIFILWSDYKCMTCRQFSHNCHNWCSTVTLLIAHGSVTCPGLKICWQMCVSLEFEEILYHKNCIRMVCASSCEHMQAVLPFCKDKYLDCRSCRYLLSSSTSEMEFCMQTSEHFAEIVPESLQFTLFTFVRVSSGFSFSTKMFCLHVFQLKHINWYFKFISGFI